ncbi:5-formyltetrahydrofolate cyclo-ligase [Rhizorhabdus histidinilytica]
MASEDIPANDHGGPATFPIPAAPPMDADPSKPALRAELRALRDAFVLDLPPGERARLEALAADHLLRVAGGARSIAFYVAMGSEMGCAAAMAATAARGIAVALPHVESRSAPMRFLRWTPGDPLETGWRGLSQPAAESAEIRPDLIVAPLLGFDRRSTESGRARVSTIAPSPRCRRRAGSAGAGRFSNDPP